MFPTKHGFIEFVHPILSEMISGDKWGTCPSKLYAKWDERSKYPPSKNSIQSNTPPINTSSCNFLSVNSV